MSFKFSKSSVSFSKESSSSTMADLSKLVDFSFAINIKQSKENVLKELSPTHENVFVLKNLGINIKNEDFIIWNDYYSAKQILIKLKKVYALDNPIINNYIDQFDALILNNNYSYKL